MKHQLIFLRVLPYLRLKEYTATTESIPSVFPIIKGKLVQNPKYKIDTVTVSKCYIGPAYGSTDDNCRYDVAVVEMLQRRHA